MEYEINKGTLAIVPNEIDNSSIGRLLSYHG